MYPKSPGAINGGRGISFADALSRLVDFSHLLDVVTWTHLDLRTCLTNVPTSSAGFVAFH